jgi:hypothetical protein
MKAKRFLFIRGLLMMLLLGLSACGGSGDSSIGESGGGGGGSSVTEITGNDADGDGVWDYIGNAIQDRYPNDSAKQNAMKQEAKALQAAVLAGAAEDSAGMMNAARLLTDAGNCLFMTAMTDALGDIAFLEALIANTDARLDAYDAFNAGLSNQFFGEGNTENPCE